MPDINTIGRTIAVTKARYTRGGRASAKYTEELYGDLDAAKAQRRLRAMFEDDTIVVLDVQVTKKHYVMSLEDFVLNAHVTREYTD